MTKKTRSIEEMMPEELRLQREYANGAQKSAAEYQMLAARQLRTLAGMGPDALAGHDPGESLHTAAQKHIRARAEALSQAATTKRDAAVKVHEVAARARAKPGDPATHVMASAIREATKAGHYKEDLSIAAFTAQATDEIASERWWLFGDTALDVAADRTVAGSASRGRVDPCDERFAKMTSTQQHGIRALYAACHYKEASGGTLDRWRNLEGYLCSDIGLTLPVATSIARAVRAEKLDAKSTFILGALLATHIPKGRAEEVQTRAARARSTRAADRQHLMTRGAS